MLHPTIECAKTAPALLQALVFRVSWLALAMLALAGSPACVAAEEAPSAASRVETLARFADIPQRGIVLGDGGAPVTLTIFVDLQCPFCREFAHRVEPSLVEHYARTGKGRLVLQNLAFLGPESRKAAQMAGAVGLQDHLWQFTDLLFASTHHENSGEMTDDFLRRVAGAIPQVDVDRAAAAIETSAVTDQIEAARLLARRFGIHAAPTFLLGRTGQTPSVLVPDQMTPEAFARAIDALLPPG